MSGTKVHSNYEDLLTFTRASKGHALRPVSYGTELVTNGTFNSDTTGWTLTNTSGTATFTQANQEATFTRQAFGDKVHQEVSCVVGRIYKVSCNLTAVSGGTARVRFNSTNSTTGDNAVADSTSSGEFSLIVVANASTMYFVFDLNANSASVTLDNVSVKEVLFDQPDGTLTLFEHPEGVPRVEWDADRNRLGLLVEESRVNQLTYSEDFSQWVRSRTALTATTETVSPDGQTNAYKAVPNNSTNAHFFEINGSSPYIKTTTSGTNFTYSIYAKAAEYDVLQIASSTGFAARYQNFDLTNGVKLSGNADGATIEYVGNGWYRCSITEDTTGSVARFLSIPANSDITRNAAFLGDGTSGIYVWGAQAEENASFPTSYMKTTGSTATRSADVASIPVADFGFNADAGTVFVEASVLNDQNSNDRRILEISDGTTSNFFSFYQDVSAGENISIANQSGGSLTANFDTGFTITESSIFKAVATLKDNDVAASVNGGSITSDTSTTISSALSEVNIGYLGGGTQQINGHIKSIQYYPRRLTNAQLEALTEPRSTPTLSLTFDGLESSYTENYIHG